MSDKPDRLVFHSLHRRHVRGGCMPVFLLLAIAFLGGVFMCVRVEMKPPLRPAGVGNLLYRKDELLETQIRQRSPLPLRLPRYVAPLRQDEGVVNLPLRRRLNAAEAPEELPFPTAADSVVLNATALLELPPVEAVDKVAEIAPEAGAAPSAAPSPSPVAPAPAENPPPLVEPAPSSPALSEPSSASLQGKEVA